MGKIKDLMIYTSKIKSDEIKILIASDLHLTRECGQKNLNRIMNSKELDYAKLDFIIMPGDLTNDCNDLEDKDFKKYFIESLDEFTKGIPTVVSYGNHDQMTKHNSDKWRIGNRKLVEEALGELPNFKLIKNGENVKTPEIDFAAFSPVFSYYEGLKEDMSIYEKNFFANYDESAFKDDKYSIFLTHEPQSIIKLSEELGSCIQPNTDLVISGHMHNGLLLNPLHRFAKNRGIISPQMELFPKFAQGEYSVDETDFIINGPVNTRVETPRINELYGASATTLTLKKTR